MKIKILSVGKIKEKFFKEAIAEYQKRLSRYCNLEIIEVSDEKTPDKASEAVNQQILQIEGERLLKNINDNDYVIALAIEGKNFSSIELASHIEQLCMNRNSQISFVIGGSLGLADSVLRRADESLSFSNLTFPHQLMRVILLEQIYRCFRIINNEPYHK